MKFLQPVFQHSEVQDDNASIDAQRIDTERWRPLDLIVGTPGNDSLVGTSNPDTLDGGAGNDTLLGGALYDTLLGGAGDDQMYGGADGDYFVDGPGDGADTINGESGSDQLTADWSDATGNIVWINDQTTRAVNGQVITSIEEVDITFGAGNDVYVALFSDQADDVDGGAGNDSLNAGGGYDELLGGAGNDTLTGVGSSYALGIVDADGGEGDDLISGGAAAWHMEGGNGNDTLIGGTEMDVGRGGAGNDVMMAGGPNPSSWGDQFHGDDGNDTITGAGDDEFLDGGAGNDSMVGNAGDDSFEVGASGEADTVNGGDGDDQVEVAWGNATQDIVWTNTPGTLQVVNGLTIVGVESISGTLGSGNDTLINLPNAFAIVHGGAGNDYLTGRFLYGDAGNDTMVGSDQYDELYGFDGNDSLQGGDGDDTLYGGTGLDKLKAGAGNDDLQGDYVTADVTQADSYEGGSGTDKLTSNWSSSSASVTVTLNGGSHTAYGDTFSGIEKFDLSFGSGNDNVLAGTADTIKGGGGNDVLHNGGNVDGGTGNDTLVGDAGNDKLYDSSGNNWLEGGAGNDLLQTANGDTTLTGGAGSDQFRAGSGATDLVLDFERGIDKAQVSGSLVGNHNKTINGTATVAGPGGFASSAELVVVTANIAGDITAAKAAAAIGSANSAYTSSSSAMFVVDNGIDTAVYLFDSSGSDAQVSAAELDLMLTLQGVAQTSTSDFGLF